MFFAFGEVASLTAGLDVVGVECQLRHTFAVDLVVDFGRWGESPTALAVLAEGMKLELMGAEEAPGGRLIEVDIDTTGGQSFVERTCGRSAGQVDSM